MQSSEARTAHPMPEAGNPLPANTILIYEKSDAYFFPLYAGSVFSPFGVPQPSFRYLLYQLLRLFHLPGLSLFWGRWKAAARKAERVILFDYGYQRGMERYIRRVNPRCQVCLFFWNRVNRYNKAHLHFRDKSAIFSTDPVDCETYGLKYQHIFYPMEYYTPYRAPAGPGRLFFLGADKGRALFIASLKPLLEESGLTCDIRILTSVDDPAYRERYRDILSDRRLSYNEYLALVKSCDVLLDINQAGQSALTMRVMEALFLSKKLITNNGSVLDCDFYDPGNILVISENRLPDPEEIQRFLLAPFRPCPASVLERYSLGHWLEGFAGQPPHSPGQPGRPT